MGATIEQIRSGSGKPATVCELRAKLGDQILGLEPQITIPARGF